MTTGSMGEGATKEQRERLLPQPRHEPGRKFSEACQLELDLCSAQVDGEFLADPCLKIRCLHRCLQSEVKSYAAGHGIRIVVPTPKLPVVVDIG